MITNQSEAHGYHYRLAPRGYVFSVFAGRANGARTLVRRKIGRRRSLEISKRGSALPAFLRDKSRAPGEFLVGALNRYPSWEGNWPDGVAPLLGGAGGGFTGAMHAKSSERSLPGPPLRRWSLPISFSLDTVGLLIFYPLIGPLSQLSAVKGRVLSRRDK